MRRRVHRGGHPLQELWLFADCSARELEEISQLGRRVRVAAGSRVVSQGDTGTDVMVVISGCALCSLDGRLVALFGAGDFFGEIAALDGRPRTATVDAVSDLELIVFERRPFDRLLAFSSSLAVRVLQVAARRLRSANDLVAA